MRTKKSLYSIFIIIYIGSLIPLYSQNTIDDEIDSNRRKLKNIRIKIDSLKQNIADTESEKRSVLEQLEIIHNEMAFLNQARILLRKEINLLSKRIGQTEKELEEIKNVLKKLRMEAAQRIIYNYKYGKIKNIELLLNSSSLNQALARYKYLKYLWQQEVRLINSIKLKIEEKIKLEDAIHADLENRKKTLKEKESDHKKYLATKNKKEILIRQLKWTEDNLRKELAALEKSRKMIQQSILDREEQKRRKVVKTHTVSDQSFNKNKGKLLWPVKGKIIRKYGKVHDKTLNTWVNNTGIDIKAKAGTKIRAIFSGVVSMITYLPGYGNTIIIDHSDGYYTVYSHLEDIYVEREELIEKDQLIALVGDSGSLEGPKLHFEIYANQKTENPLFWLQ
jgi:septal ring factor EnvC (AmiA/AmiB activator)